MTNSNDGHSHLSPSKYDRWSLCPGSKNLCATVPKAPTSSYAAEGTFAHTAFETALRRGKLLMDDVDGNEEMFTALTKSIAIVKEEMARFAKIEIIEYEQRVTPILSRPDTAGTSDVVLAGHMPDGKRVSVSLDLKYGAGVPVSANAGQLKLYAMGTANLLGGYFDAMRSVVIQPRLKMKAPPVRAADHTLESMVTFYKQTHAAVLATDAPDAPTIFDPKACRWCDAKNICTTYQNRPRKMNADFLAAIESV